MTDDGMVNNRQPSFPKLATIIQDFLILRFSRRAPRIVVGLVIPSNKSPTTPAFPFSFLIMGSQIRESAAQRQGTKQNKPKNTHEEGEGMVA